MMYTYGIEPAISNGEGIAMVVFMGFFFFIYLAVFGLMITGYVLGALGMYRIAQRRGIHRPWLAWIPVANGWLLGSISDQFQYVTKQKVTNRRKIILILEIVLVAVYLAIMGLGIGVTVAMDANPNMSEVGVIIGMMLGMLALFGVAITVLVFAYLAYFDLFRSCRPQNEVVFLVLGVFMSITLPFFVFACSKYDLGMPPRHAPQVPAQIPPATPAEEEIPAEETPEN